MQLIMAMMTQQVQYPDALPTMMLDLSHIRKFSGFLQKTEIKFDLLSAIDELAAQADCSSDVPHLYDIYHISFLESSFMLVV